MNDRPVDPAFGPVDIEPTLADWLRAEAPTSAPSDLRRRILDRSMSARRSRGWVPRITMTPAIRTRSWGIAAVVAIAVVTVGVGLFGDRLRGVVGASPSPSVPVVTPSPSASEPIAQGPWTQGAPPPGNPAWEDPGPTYLASSDGSILALIATGPRSVDTPIDLVAYDPVADSWTIRGAIDAAVGRTLRQTPGATVLAGGDLYLVGFAQDSHDLVAWRIDGETLQGSDDAQVPRSEVPAVAGHDGRLYALETRFSGNPEQEPQTLRIYDPGTKAWSTASAMPGPRAEALLAAAPDGSIWVLGGTTVPVWTTPEETRFEPIRSIARYQPGSDTWTNGPDLPVDLTFHATAAIGPDGSLVLVVLTPPDLRTYRFDPTTVRWSELAGPPGLLTPAALHSLNDGRLVLFCAEAGQINTWGLAGPQVTWILDPHAQ